MSKFELHLGDCLEVLRGMADNSVDSIVTDPPYGLSFMGKRWDYDVPSVEIWAECLRVLKPGGHLLAFAGTRTQHRMAVRIEDAGFEVRDMIAWVYGSGFCKVGYIRDKDGKHVMPGFGGSLKPALEPITVARKPLSEGTVAANVLQHGTGALNIDGCRVGDEGGTRGDFVSKVATGVFSGNDGRIGGAPVGGVKSINAGRWPANLLHDGSEEVLAGFPQSSSGANPTRRGGMGFHGANGQDACSAPRGPETGSAARFFYCAKASKRDRDEGLEGFEAKAAKSYEGGRIISADHPETAMGGASVRANTHPTVKPTELMRYLCRLVTPPGGVVLDPFMGSGSTGKAAMREGFRFIGCEMSPEYLEIARARIAHAAGDAHAQKPPANASQIGLFA